MFVNERIDLVLLVNTEGRVKHLLKNAFVIGV